MVIDIFMFVFLFIMEQGKLVKWLKKEGDQVKFGDVLVEIEIDKVIMEVEVIDEGVFVKIFVFDGIDNVVVNIFIVIFVGEGEDVLIVVFLVKVFVVLVLEF